MAAKTSRPYITLLMSAVGIVTAEKPISKLMFGVGAFLSWADIVNQEKEEAPALSGIDLDLQDMKFEFDIGNIHKLKISCEARNILFEEVTDPFSDENHKIVESYPDPVTDEERYVCIGKTRSGNIICVIFVVREGKIRPFNVLRPKNRHLNFYHEKQ